VTATRHRLGAAAIFLGVSLLYYTANPRLPDNYKHHVYVADAWLHGRLYVEGYPPHYHDWITVDGKQYSPFAPTPAILLLPFVWVWGTNVNMNAFSMGVAGLNAMLCWLVLGRVGVGMRSRALATLFFAFGTVNWYSAEIGTSWFLAHLGCELFYLLALFEIFGRCRGLLIGAAAGFAVLSRANTITALPAVLLLALARTGPDERRPGWRALFARTVAFGIGLALPLAIELGINYARFGSPLETGYSKASELYTNMKTSGSMYHWRYIPKHLYIALFRGWEFVDEVPFLKPSPEGLSLIFTSPALFYALGAPWRERVVRRLWLAVAMTAVAILPYFAQGWVQFGYRHVLDALPYLVILTALGLERAPTWHGVLLVELSALSNALGVYWGEKLGW